MLLFQEATVSLYWHSAKNIPVRVLINSRPQRQNPSTRTIFCNHLQCFYSIYVLYRKRKSKHGGYTCTVTCSAARSLPVGIPRQLREISATVFCCHCSTNDSTCICTRTVHKCKWCEACDRLPRKPWTQSCVCVSEVWNFAFSIHLLAWLPWWLVSIHASFSIPYWKMISGSLRVCFILNEGGCSS